jgi:Flp pilus assembly protein TadG
MTIPIEPAKRTSEKGTTLVEAAIILLTFFVLLFSVFEAGRFMNTGQVLTNAAREGARFAVAPITQTNTLPSDGEIETRVQDYLTSAGIPCSGCVTVTRPTVTTGSVPTSFTQVEVTYDYQVITVPGLFSALEITLNGEALMRNETSN